MNNIEKFLELLDRDLFGWTETIQYLDGSSSFLWKNSFNEKVFVKINSDNNFAVFSYSVKFKNHDCFKVLDVKINRYQITKLNGYISLVVNRENSVNEI